MARINYTFKNLKTLNDKILKLRKMIRYLVIWNLILSAAIIFACSLWAGITIHNKLTDYTQLELLQD